MSDNINNEKRGFKGVWIPAKIWLNKDLSLLEKCLLVEINSLDNDDGCFASNEYLANFLNTSEPTISRAIAKLKVIGDIYQSSFNGRQRSLKVKPNIIEPNQNDKAEYATNQNDEAALSKRQGSHINLTKSSIDNNIVNNKTKYTSDKSDKSIKDNQKQFIDEYNRLFIKTYGHESEYVIGTEKKDYPIITSLIKKYSIEKIKGALSAYFSSEWHKQNTGHTLGGFSGKIDMWLNKSVSLSAPRVSTTTGEVLKHDF